MKRKRMTAIGIACGVLCAACVLLYLQGVRGEAEAARAEALARYGGEQLEVCVATRDIAAGEQVDAGAVTAKLWVADLLPEQAARSVSDVVGKRTGSPILAGEVVSLKRFEDAAASLDVPDGMSALSVPAKEVQAVGGAVEPGMRVDIFATGDTATEAIARDVLVVATSTGSKGQKADAAVSWITVAVEPDRVQELVAASQKTALYFVLPGSGADAEGAADGANTPASKQGKGDAR